MRAPAALLARGVPARMVSVRRPPHTWLKEATSGVRERLVFVRCCFVAFSGVGCVGFRRNVRTPSIGRVDGDDDYSGC
jgi:hypothetical protein